jgi:hypothetical protein
MNRLTDPIVAHTLSGAALSPCSDAGGNRLDLSGAGTHHEAGADDTPLSDAPALWSVPAVDAPSDVPLEGLRRTLRELCQATTASAMFLCDLSEFERGRHRPDPVRMCHWLDQLQTLAEETRSAATLLQHVCDVLWDRASAEASERRQAELEVTRSG